MSRVKATLILLTTLFVSACGYDFPLSEKQGLPIDRSVLGLWEEVNNETVKHRVLISATSESEYFVHMSDGTEDLFLRGYPLRVAGISLVQLAVTDKRYIPINETGSYFSLSYEVSDGNLVIKLPDTGILSTGLKSSAHLREAFIINKDNPRLFSEPARLRKINANKSKLADLEATLRYAAEKGDVATMLTLLTNGVNVNGKDKKGTTALMDAASNGQIPALQVLLVKGANVDARDESGITALFYAASNGQVPALQMLLTRGANIEARAEDGLTALMLAASSGEVPALQALLAKGANIDARTEDGGTALMLAAGDGQVRAMQALLAKGADINAKDKKGWTALMCAASFGEVPAIQVLTTNGADVNAGSASDVTALMVAALNGHTTAVQALLAKGANVYAIDKTGYTALDSALLKPYSDVVKVLREEMNKPCPANSSNEYLFRLNGRVQTGIVIKRGDRLTFSASGVVTFGILAGGGGPEGINGFRGYNLVGDVQHGALVARINKDEGWYVIGRGQMIVANVDGILELAVNDMDAGNNTGQFEVKISICKAR